MKSIRRERRRVASHICNQSGQIEGRGIDVCCREVGSHNGINGGGCEAESSCNRNRVSGGENIKPITTDSILQAHQLQKYKSSLVDKIL